MTLLKYRDLKKDKKLSGDDIYSILCIQDLTKGYIKIFGMSDIQMKLALKERAKKRKNSTNKERLLNDLELRLINQYGERIYWEAVNRYNSYFAFN